jgi:hypothetical protein
VTDLPLPWERAGVRVELAHNIAMRAPLALLLLTTLPAFADVAQGEKLVQEKNCETCHHNKTMGDASAIYLRKDHKVTSLEKLKAQVAVCNSELNLGMFPDEEDSVVEFLDARYYRFKSSRSISK